ncbi:flagellar hook-basal body complex protein [Anaerovibrio lipolyticus]|uniref:flagellar hook-basal body complex protein n=1 Tax=Anaerovibrio lipolyticus TaxID=82374 RepID=UPI001F298F30|nr:flagellar hook-basal body complex protein [Anaerovibrio lipolyticus]MCF2600519.1 flagellar hook-basal body complex protein [Anaerovibrio lipolyticus]
MMRSLYSGVSGLKNHQTRMDVVGNNISNVNTTGFKSSRVTFSDTLSQTLSGASAPTDNTGGTNPKQIGLGSSVSSIDTLFTDGSVQNTGKNTDLCLSGNGLFVVKPSIDSDELYYTRNGAFEFDAKGNFVMPGSGMFVGGWMAENGVIKNTTESNMGVINIPAGKTMGATATTTVNYDKNLNANVEGYTISNMVVKYADGTSKTVTNYVPNPPTIILDTTTNKHITLDANAAYDFTTGDSLYGKDLFAQKVAYVEGPANVTLSETNSLKNKVEGLGEINYTTGNHIIDNEITLTGTIVNQGVTTSGPDTGETRLTLKLDLPVEKKGTEVTITIPPGNIWTYKDGDTASFKFPIEGIEPQATSKIHRSDGTEYEFESNTLDPKITKENYNNYIYKGHTADGDVKAVSHKGDDVESVTVNTSDGKSLTGLTQVKYNQGDNFYPSYTTLATVYDSLGGEHSVPILFTKQANNTWSMSLGNGGSSVSVTDSEQRTINYNLISTDLVFDDKGGYISGSATLKVHYDYGKVQNSKGEVINPPSDQSINVNVGSLTQYSGSTSINGSSDGNAMGTLKSVSVDSSGIITGVYTNGLHRTEAQVAIAQFNNAAGLTKSGGSLYEKSNNSGEAHIESASALGVTITPSALEMSNVDMASELTDMIVTQRGYQSNSKIITVSDELLETLINMKR